ncbi:MAG: hypothetical protein V3R87_08545 [Dehalococcoidia bacterium]
MIITFVSPFKPIICGIADYTDFVTRECPAGKWAVLSFNLNDREAPLSQEHPSPTTPVWYVIPSRTTFTATSILEGLGSDRDQVIWFQHEFGIWRDNARFVDMLAELPRVKVVTLHSLHFQSHETVYGLRRHEHLFLSQLLPHTDAITVFSNGVRRAVLRAFPEFHEKVHLLQHGTHLFPGLATLSRAQAKAMIHDYLVDESPLDQESKKQLREQRVFLDPGTTVLGGAGFITASKGIDLLFHACDTLQQMLPERKIAAVYVGLLRESGGVEDSRCAEALKSKSRGKQHFLLETYLPAHMLPVLLRALDVYFYWPTDCTQSGILAHALGAGATIACRDMEGVGEAVRIAGGLTSHKFGDLIAGIQRLILEPGLGDQASEKASVYAQSFSWKNQASRHFELAEELCRYRVGGLATASPPAPDSSADGEPSSVG